MITTRLSLDSLSSIKGTRRFMLLGSVILALAALIVCSDDPSEPNQPPSTPASPTPADSATSQPVSLQLGWQASDPENDKLTYEISFGDVNPPPVVATGHGTTQYAVNNLGYDTQYFWRVTAIDAQGQRSTGALWVFRTVVNTAPATPSNPVPHDGATDQPTNITLSWQSNDSEGHDLEYALRFGTTIPPPTLVSSHPDTFYAVGPLANNQTYYWQIAATDEPGDNSLGPIWSFSTTPPPIPPLSSRLPESGGVGLEVDGTLLWSITPTPGFPLTFDVYFGDTPDPPLVVSGQTATSYAPGTMTVGRTYYWKLLIHQGNLQREEPVWSFTVEDAKPGHIYTWAGTGGVGWGMPGQHPKATDLYWPVDVAFDVTGTPHILDWNNHRVLAEDASGNLQVKIGCASPGTGCEIFGDAPDGPANQIGLNHPTHVSWDADGDLILSAWHNSLLKRLDTSTGNISTFCGDGRRDFLGDGEPAADAVLNLPVCVVADAAGNLYVSDQANMRVRRIDVITNIINTVVGSGPSNPPQPGYGGDAGPADQARLAFEAGQAGNPSGKICFDQNEDMYIADTGNHIIRVVRKSNGYIYTFAGTPQVPGHGGDGSDATSALLRGPRDVACDGAGNVYIADTGNHCIRKVDTGGTITTVAGTPTQFGSDSRDGLLATQARFTSPMGVEIGPMGRLWIADMQNNVIRVVY